MREALVRFRLAVNLPLFLLKYLVHFTFRLEGNVNNLDVNSLYLLPSTENFISWTTRKSDEAGPSPHNILEYIV